MAFSCRTSVGLYLAGINELEPSREEAAWSMLFYAGHTELCGWAEGPTAIGTIAHMRLLPADAEVRMVLIL